MISAYSLDYHVIAHGTQNAMLPLSLNRLEMKFVCSNCNVSRMTIWKDRGTVWSLKIRLSMLDVKAAKKTFQINASTHSSFQNVFAPLVLSTVWRICAASPTFPFELLPPLPSDLPPRVHHKVVPAVLQHRCWSLRADPHGRVRSPQWLPEEELHPSTAWYWTECPLSSHPTGVRGDNYQEWKHIRLKVLVVLRRTKITIMRTKQKWLIKSINNARYILGFIRKDRITHH